MLTSEYQSELWPLLVYTIIVFLVAGGMLGLSYLLGQRHHERETHEPFESGVLTVGSARIRLSARFYLVAMFFVIFDLEAVFIIAWAISVREAGWTGYIGVSFFVFVLLAVLVYEWRTGALELGINGKKIIKAMKKYKEENN